MAAERFGGAATLRGRLARITTERRTSVAKVCHPMIRRSAKGTVKVRAHPSTRTQRLLLLY
jgi:hypothetical protein